MKKNLKYALLSAIALVGAVSFSACSSSDEIVDNPDYNPVDNTVKTQFTISLPQNVVKGTRQSAATVQNDQTVASFRGFDNMVLIPYASVSNGGDVTGDRLTTTSITLNPGSGSANTLPGGSSGGLDDTNNNNSYVYSDVSIPLGTSGFLFYGKAIDAGTDKFVDGYLTATPNGLTGQKTGFGFALNPTKPSDNDGKAVALLAYINSIAAAAPTESTAKAWYTPLVDGGNAGLLGLYNNFITLKAGSSTSVQAALEDLYESLKNNMDPASQAVCKAILGSDENIMAVYDGTKAENQRLTLKESVAGYPSDINLPDGAVGLTWSNATPAVASWLNDNSAWSTGSSTVTALDKYVYPASLYYRADSPVKVSNSKQSSNYSSKSGWGAIITDLYDGSSVGSSTQSVALVEQIQYAVAQLESHVKIAATTLKDRKGDVINIGTGTTDDGTFKLTGILIGGQKNVDWQFLPTGASIYTIYDKDIPSASNVLSATTGSGSEAINYTLALENAENESVYVALEFENNAKDFMGKDGLIAKGTKFYLVAQLDPTDKTGDGHTATGDLNKVFKQDYKTIVTFKIKENTIAQPSSDPEVYPDGLGAAYNVIPDLRTPKMELGLSVDLTWQQGLQFDINL